MNLRTSDSATVVKAMAVANDLLFEEWIKLFVQLVGSAESSSRHGADDVSCRLGGPVLRSNLTIASLTKTSLAVARSDGFDAIRKAACANVRQNRSHIIHRSFCECLRSFVNI